MPSPTTFEMPSDSIVNIVSEGGPTTRMEVAPYTLTQTNRDQSTDLAERLLNSIDKVITYVEYAAVCLAHYDSLGGATALDQYFQIAPTTGPTKDQLVAAITSSKSVIEFIKAGHLSNFYTVKSKGSSQRL